MPARKKTAAKSAPRRKSARAAKPQTQVTESGVQWTPSGKHAPECGDVGDVGEVGELGSNDANHPDRQAQK